MHCHWILLRSRSRFSREFYFILAILCAVPARCQETEFLDNTWTVSVNGQTVQVNPDGYFRIANISAPDQFGVGGPGTPPDFRADDFVRAVGVSHAGGVTRYAFSEPFQIIRAQRFRIGPMSFTTTPPPLPVSIAITATSALVPIGETLQLTTTATLQNGTQQNVTPRTSWTIYRTSNASVATVNELGVLAGHAVGPVVITAVNDGATAVKQFTVTQAIERTNIEGIVQLEDGTPFVGASITTTFGGAATSGPGGLFTIPDFEIPSEAETITVRATADIGGDDYRGTSEMVNLIPEGVTDAGIIVLRPVIAEFENAFGSPLLSGDDTFTFVNIGFNFPFYGTTQTGVYVGTNGYFTFGSGDSDFSESIAEHLSPQPRISAFFDDLYPGSAGADRVVKLNRLTNPNRFVVTWDRVPHFSSGGSNTLQIILFDDGRIQFGYRGMTATNSVVGLSPGGSNPPVQTVDFSSLLAGQSFPALTAIVQQFTSGFDLDGGFLVFQPLDGGGYDATFIPPQNEGSVNPGTLSGRATNLDGTPCVGQVEVSFSCDQSYRRVVSLDSQGRYLVTKAPFGGGLRVSLVGQPSVFGTDVIPNTVAQGTIDVMPVTTSQKVTPP